MLILLADDERLIRLGLQSMLEELYPGQHTYLHARNGNEVVNILKTNTPDVAFLDVKMPLMNGLDALRICKQMSDQTVWIILSGYADFEYARQAITLSTFDYILKPVDMETLKNLFERIHASRALCRLQNNAVFAHDVVRSFNMADQFSPEETEFLPAASSDYILYQFYIDVFRQDLQKEIKQTLCDNLEKFCSSNVSILNHCLFFNTDGNLCLVCDAPDASRLTHFIKVQTEDFPPNAFSVFWGNRKTIREIYEVSQRIARVADIRLILDCSDPMFVKNAEVLPSLTLQLSFVRELISLLNLYIGRDRNGFLEKLSLLERNSDFARVFPFINVNVLQNYLSGIFGTPICIHTFDDLTGLLKKNERSLADGIPAVSARDIAEIKNYVCKNYAKDVSMSCVSEHFNLSPTYLSRLFHEKTGQKYIDYVTQVRMEEAKKLLTEHDSPSVKQVAEAVGYSSVRHFSRNFQKYTGMLPSAFH